MEEEVIYLGFLEKKEGEFTFDNPDKYNGKVGGKPIWLDFEHIPCSLQENSNENIKIDLSCSNCKNPLSFFLQIYAPLNQDSTFHRTLFVFCCKNGDCYKEDYIGRFKVLRCQLTKDNPYYIEDRNGEWIKNIAHPMPNLCVICGQLGTKHCGKCKAVHYCSRFHQIEDWKGGHFQVCSSVEVGTLEINSFPRKISTSVFDEFELVTEIENLPQENNEEILERENELKEKFKEICDENIEENFFDNFKKDKMFIEFQKAIKAYPDQCLRYYGSVDNKNILWISENNQPKENDIPNCSCGSKRIAEFQILPQILYQLKVDLTEKAIDFGILTVYTCKLNCNHPEIKTGGYLEEFLWKQDITS